MRFGVSVDRELIDEAARVAGGATKREAIEVTLPEFVRRRRLARMLEQAGQAPLAMSLDDLLRSRARAGPPRVWQGE